MKFVYLLEAKIDDMGGRVKSASKFIGMDFCEQFHRGDLPGLQFSSGEGKATTSLAHLWAIHDCSLCDVQMYHVAQREPRGLSPTVFVSLQRTLLRHRGTGSI
jgi:hypothetical protein